MSDVALASYFETCLRRHPELRLALPYLPAADRDALAALACLEQQFLDAIYGIADSGVAASKLHWWVEEFEQALAGGARHPLSRAVFANARAGAVVLETWTAPIGAGLALRGTPPASDFAAQLELIEPFHAALARLENSYWFGAEAGFARAARLATLGYLLRALGRIVDAPVPATLPMNLLARHAVSRADLVHSSPERQALLADQLGNLQQAWHDAVTLGGPLSLFRALTGRMDRAQLHRAQTVRDVIPALQPECRRPGPAMAWFAWRAARAWRRASKVESTHEQI